MNRLQTSQPKSQRVTIRTVAADAGVSVAAVSKVLRDAYGVSAALRARVEASIAKLNYRPRAAARGMRGQTYTIGVLMPDIRNAFFPDILDGVTAGFARTPYQTIIGVGRTSATIEKELVYAMLDRQMDGLVMIGQRMSSADAIAVAAKVPTVVVGHHEPDAVNFDSVNNDDVLGARLVVEHLVSQGYRRISMVSIASRDLGTVDVSFQREIGYRAAMAEAGLGQFIRIVAAFDQRDDITRAFSALMQGSDAPEALFCWADYYAIEVLGAAKTLGLRVPQDIAIIGYDNSTPCSLSQNDLTSVDQSGYEIGSQASRMLLERIEGRQAPEHYVVVPRVIARGSTARR